MTGDSVPSQGKNSKRVGMDNCSGSQGVRMRADLDDAEEMKHRKSRWDHSWTEGHAFSEEERVVEKRKKSAEMFEDQKASADSVQKVKAAVKKHQHRHSLKNRYEFLETLGRGTYGKVKKAVEKGTGRTVAIKLIQKEKITDDLDRVHLQREIEIMSSLKHPNIIQIYEVFENKDKIIIVMEYASVGELYDYVNDRLRITENEARIFFRQTVSAVHYCHKKGVVHRDLKLENILLDEHRRVKLADFGLSTLYKKGQMLNTYCGSPLYASPEVVNALPYQGPEVDCWALGVLLYALVYGSMPFDSYDYRTLTDQISSGRYRQPPNPSDACGLIDWMLNVKAEGRATIEDIANHWWVNWGYDDSVCDCDSSSECQSPLLARYIDWQNRPQLEMQPKEKEDESDQETSSKSHSSPLRRLEKYGSCLKKSKKENDMKHPQQVIVSMTVEKKPKGILKARSSFDSAFLPSTFNESLSHLCSSAVQEADSPTLNELDGFYKAPTELNNTLTKMPKKGILKKTCHRESGYSSSPERGEPLHSSLEVAKQEKVIKSDKAICHRKGILKRNGKFSTSLELAEDNFTISLSDSFNELLLSSGGRPKILSRPPSVISDDSLLSSDSFDLLDMAAETKRQLFAHSPGNLTFSSASKEDLASLDDRDFYDMYSNTTDGYLDKNFTVKDLRQHNTI
ncbi:NUAK family SNF1-like kinase 1 [Protopterus annectens]|uniref:NUAK family SNF1-like kinase 1 n=1 Tax=Protopterus annectens TaxID=7888 RepID=UPI001CFA0601|nr:NUAK family SNF1-like kinase 1 [Protopterus annectens]